MPCLPLASSFEKIRDCFGNLKRLQDENIMVNNIIKKYDQMISNKTKLDKTKYDKMKCDQAKCDQMGHKGNK